MIIPFFVPELACPNRCIFCNQHTISGWIKPLETKEIKPLIEQYLQSYKDNGRKVEVAFFGGNFTGIDIETQKSYLQEVKPYIDSKIIDSVRISTRPDYISEDKLNFLKQNGVRTVELGAQSFDNEVLTKCGRGHNTEATIESANLINKYGFDLGLQMMIGLPADTEEKAINTAKTIVSLGAKNTRIYPTLVLHGTQLQTMYEQNLYQPLTMQQAVSQAAKIVPIFVDANVEILRIGLHPSSDLQDGSGFVAGPYHPAFGNLVYSKVWDNIFSELKTESKSIIISVPKKQINSAVGHKAVNKINLLKRFSEVKIIGDDMLTKMFDYHVDYC